jgi:hypothetical protein
MEKQAGGFTEKNYARIAQYSKVLKIKPFLDTQRKGMQSH